MATKEVSHFSVALTLLTLSLPSASQTGPIRQ